jgi:aldose 1-epimerase
MMLRADDASAVVDAEHGGRLASLQVAGRELLVQPGEVGDEPTLWGCYPMVPWAGRIRDGRFRFGGDQVQLPVNAPPHAMHGVGFDRAWDEVGPGQLRLDLDWPFGGTAEQRFELNPDRLTLSMTVTAERPMPVSAGWHPCFRGQPVVHVEASAMHERDADGIPTGRLVPPPPGPWDDAFEGLQYSPWLAWPDGLEVTLESLCPVWVVYDQDPRLVCVEPQTAAPDAVNREPFVVHPGAPLELALDLVWDVP